jgi:hypothetical protein
VDWKNELQLPMEPDLLPLTWEKLPALPSSEQIRLVCRSICRFFVRRGF